MGLDAAVLVLHLRGRLKGAANILSGLRFEPRTPSYSGGGLAILLVFLQVRRAKLRGCSCELKVYHRIFLFNSEI